jgi:thioredoxin reductase (NADPH)
MPEPPQSSNTPSAGTSFRPEMAFPFLTDEMVARLHTYGHVENFAAETPLWARGDREVDMFVVLEGTVQVFARDKYDQRKILSTLQPSQFTGELDLLSSRRTLVEGCTGSDCLLLRVPRSELQRLMRAEGDIANLIMQATIWRRVGIVEKGAAGLLLIGHDTSAETIQLRRFLTRNNYPFQLVEPTDVHAAYFEATYAAPMETLLPTVILTDRTVLHRPTLADLADQLGINELLDPENIYDLTIVGAGPSGLAAAVYAASEGLSTLVIETNAPGGQAGTSSKIENYLGFPTGVSGQELANRAWVQAQKFGARLAISRPVTCIDQVNGLQHLTLAGGATLRSRAVLIATGAAYRKLDAENFERFEGQGIQYAATAMEATLCRGSEVAVVGGGNSAGQAAIFLSGIASHVHLIIRRGSLAATMSSYLISRIESSPRITLHTYTEIEKLDGDNVLRCITCVNRETGERFTREIGNIFVMIGAEPNTGWLYGTLALDRKGFILTGTHEAFENTRYATTVPGIYAVGDVRSGSVKRVASSVGEGSVVVSDIHRYLASQRDVPAAPESTLAALQAVEIHAQG